jgi:hypothetical protein
MIRIALPSASGKPWTAQGVSNVMTRAQRLGVFTMMKAAR